VCDPALVYPGDKSASAKKEPRILSRRHSLIAHLTFSPSSR
jgi:hypothetical protein